MPKLRKIEQQSIAEQAERQRYLLVWCGLGLLFIAVGIAAHFGNRWLQLPSTLPLQHVVIKGDFKNLQPAALQHLVMRAAKGGFFAVDMQSIRQIVEQQAWVDRASVRRIWPDTLHVDVVEQVPLARWGKDALVNQRGESFRPGDGRYPAGLPHLNGPEGTSQEVSQRFRQITSDMREIGLKVKMLQMDQRRAWVMVTEQNIWFELGSQQIEQRLHRFINLYRQLHEVGQRELRSVDLRYRHGFALRWQRQKTEAEMGV